MLKSNPWVPECPQEQKMWQISWEGLGGSEQWTPQAVYFTMKLSYIPIHKEHWGMFTVDIWAVVMFIFFSL